MTEQEKIDICEALYGKMIRGFGILYWSDDRKHLVNIMTGDDLASHIDYNTYQRPQYVNRQYIKLLKKTAFIKDRQNKTMVYNADCKPILKIEKDIRVEFIKEYIPKFNSLAIYILGMRSVAKGMSVLVTDTIKGEVVKYYDNVVRVFESPELLKLITLENGELQTTRFQL